tara:strand:- start:1713 stop:2195 length:483 start_codon:yes stop_codon:yes gene_type:complete
MCGEAVAENSLSSTDEQAAVADMVTKKSAANPGGRAMTTEVIPREEIEQRLKELRETPTVEIEAGTNVPETTPAVSPKPAKKRTSADEKRKFSETMWFMSGLDGDQLVDDSDDVDKEALSDRYEKKKTMSKTIRKQFSLTVDGSQTESSPGKKSKSPEKK